MTTKCERCGQPILPDDTSCWQCGARLTPVWTAPGNGSAPQSDAPELPTISWGMMAYLGAATAVTLLLLIWLGNTLAHRPLLQANPDAPALRGWNPVTAPDFAYTLTLPPRWQWAFQEQGALFEEQLRMLKAEGIQNILPASLSEPHFLATSADEKPLVLLVTEEDSFTDPAAMLTAVSTTPGIESAKQLPHYLGYEQVSYYQTMPVNGELWRCRVQTHFSQQPAYTMAVCGPAAEMEAVAAQITYALESFQPRFP